VAWRRNRWAAAVDINGAGGGASFVPPPEFPPPPLQAARTNKGGSNIRRQIRDFKGFALLKDLFILRDKVDMPLAAHRNAVQGTGRS